LLELTIVLYVYSSNFFALPRAKQFPMPDQLDYCVIAPYNGEEDSNDDDIGSENDGL